MEHLTAADLGPSHIGMVTDDGWEIMWLLDQPLYPHGATLHLRHTDTGKWSLLDCEPGYVLHLGYGTPARWLEIAHDVAEQVTSS